ncbi:MAG: hypothetical protein DCC68_11410 [Planctomycetota bacterium]|nr:MAG: hypothetical protein DCC68_11410 [Planctomycetota bacterium]
MALCAVEPAGLTQDRDNVDIDGEKTAAGMATNRALGAVAKLAVSENGRGRVRWDGGTKVAFDSIGTGSVVR